MSAIVLLHPPRVGETLAQQQAAADVGARGYAVLYRHGETNYCPGCGRVQWLVGRSLAECAVCATALPIASASPGKDL